MKRNGVLLTMLTVISLPLFLYQNLTANVGCVERGETQQSNPKSEVQNPKLDKKEFTQKTMKLQMPFIANNGQMDERVKFYAKTFGGTVFVTKEGEIVYALPNNSSEFGLHERDKEQASRIRCQGLGIGEMSYVPRLTGNSIRSNHNVLDLFLISYGEPLSQIRNPKHVVSGVEQSEICGEQRRTIQNQKSGVALREEFVGSRIKAIQGEQPSVTKVSYFKGNDPSKWKTNIFTYDAVNLGEIYDGIELKLRAYGNNVEKLFCVRSGADPEKIKIGLDGTRSIKVNKEGQLEAETELGPVKFTKPVAYQEIEGKRVEVDVEYRTQRAGVRRQVLGIRGQPDSRQPTTVVYGFKVASYDKSKPLIIDPLLASTYLGGSDYDGGYAIVLDTSGNVYVAGDTESSGFPTTSGVYDTSYNGGGDVFVSKLNSGLTSLLASTYLGGSDYDDSYAIGLDTSGNVYVTGETYSINFPTTRGAYDTSINGDDLDVFVSKLSSGLTSLLASTYLGGSDYEDSYTIGLDTSGNVYVTGETDSKDFPTASGAYDTSYNGNGDVFVSKLNSGLTSLLASTFLGGSDVDYSFALALDTSGHVYVTGITNSADFPTTSGAYDTSYNGGGDVFVSKLNSGMTSLLASTYLGGSDSDDGDFLTLDTSGHVYVTGITNSADFPTTSGAYDTSLNGYDLDVFVSKLSSGLTSLLASTYLGGSGEEWGYSLALDTSGNVYVTGVTYSINFPTTSGAYDTSYNGNGDVFVSKLDSDLSASTACIGAIGGQVKDAITGKPIVGASVAYGVGTSRQDFEKIDETETNEQGVYKFTPVDCGDYIVIADADGYRRSTRTNVAQVSVEDGTPEQADFELQPRRDSK